ncbi:MAG: hypothetical protein FJX23_00140 [Alphaproteobacteria bacterium]|nr:hypothetical protein [Alphaproteobacteria bacterium]
MILLQGLYQIARIQSRLECNRALSVVLGLVRAGYRRFPPRSAADFHTSAKAHRYAGGHSLAAAPLFLKAAELAPHNGDYLADYLLDLFDSGRLDAPTAASYLPRMGNVRAPAKRLRLKAALYDLGLRDAAAITFPGAKDIEGRYACFDPTNRQRIRFALDHDRFREYLLANRFNIALVGNSPCEVGKARGAEIDRHAVVIRFNNFAADSRFAADYGTKATVWFRGRNRRTQERPDERFAFIGYGVSHLFAHPADWSAIEAQQRKGTGTLTFQKTYDALFEELGSPPSTGLLAIRAVCDIIGPDAKPDCYGFSFTDHLQAGAKSHYFEKFTISSPHDWHKEAAYFRKLMGEAGE